MLQTTRAELQRLKQPLSASAHPASSNSSVSRVPPALIPLSTNEKKQSCNASTETQSKQAKRCQLEDLIRKVYINFIFFNFLNEITRNYIFILNK